MGIELDTIAPYIDSFKYGSLPHGRAVQVDPGLGLTALGFRTSFSPSSSSSSYSFPSSSSSSSSSYSSSSATSSSSFSFSSSSSYFSSSPSSSSCTALEFKDLTPKHDEPLSNFAFNFMLRLYVTAGAAWAWSAW